MEPIVKSFGRIVERVNDRLLSYLLATDEVTTGINYLYGHQSEIVDTLRQMNQTQENQAKKWPLVWLGMDFPENKGLNNGTAGTFRPKTICIFHPTKNVSKAAARYSDVIEPILYPIYETLIDELSKSTAFLSFKGSMRFDKIDHPFWGREYTYGTDANSLDRPLDCIEIRNLVLPIRRQYCENNQTPIKNF